MYDMAERELYRKGFEGLPDNVVFLIEDLPAEDMPKLYNSADAFVLPTRGEGWGRPFMEAMLMGLPVLAPKFSGQTEFMTDDTTFSIDCTVRKVDQSTWLQVPYFRDHRWCEPSVASVRERMRWVYEHPEEAAAVGAAASQHIKDNYSREAAAAAVKHRLDEIAASLAAGQPGDV